MIKELKKILPKFLLNFLRLIKRLILDFYPFHYLRYHNIINIDYKINGKLLFGKKETKFFKKKLKQSNLYLEFGSGNSTIEAEKLNKNYYSIESDKNFYNYIIKKINKKKISFIDFGVVGFYSNPLKYNYNKFKISKKAESYCSNILKNFLKKKIYPDLILVDGRFRVLAALYVYKFFLNKKKNFTIIIDDYFEKFNNVLGRKHYHILNKFFNIKKVGRFGVATTLSKKNSKILRKKINLYKFDYR